jgi:hypothetical protein
LFAVATQLVVPNDGRDDYEVLERTVELVGRRGIAERRAELHEFHASVKADEGIRDQTVVTEVKEHLDVVPKDVGSSGSPWRLRAAKRLSPREDPDEASR